METGSSSSNVGTIIRYLRKASTSEALAATSSQSEELEDEKSTASSTAAKAKMQFRIENYDGEVVYIDITPSDATFDFLTKQVGMEFGLGLDTFILQYVDSGDTILLRTVEAMARCIRTMKDGQAIIKVRKLQQ